MNAFLKEACNQIFGWKKQQVAHIQITKHAQEKMKQWTLTKEVVFDVIRNGEHTSNNVAMQNYHDYEVRVAYVYTGKTKTYRVLTAWKWFKR